MTQCVYGGFTTSTEGIVATSSTCLEVVAPDDVVVQDFLMLVQLAVLVGIFCAVLWPRSSIKR